MKAIKVKLEKDLLKVKLESDKLYQKYKKTETKENDYNGNTQLYKQWNKSLSIISDMETLIKNLNSI